MLDKTTPVKFGLEPVVDEKSQILILGTMPGDESLRLQQYYANPKNEFWVILSDVYGEPISADYRERLKFLRHKRLALWDVLRNAERTGSLDSNIKNAVPNDFGRFFASYTELCAVGFNGSKALTLFSRHIAKQPFFSPYSLLMTPLPSTSSTPGRNVLPYEEKVVRWKAFLTR